MSPVLAAAQAAGNSPSWQDAVIAVASLLFLAFFFWLLLKD